MNVRMRKNYERNYIKKILVPIINDCNSETALAAAKVIAGESTILVIGIVSVPDADSFSIATEAVHAMRNKLQRLARQINVQISPKVRVSHQLWNELVEVISQEDPSLLILEWPNHFNALGCNLMEVLHKTPCDIALVRGPIHPKPTRVLIPIRGGPYAELALRLSLAINRQCQSEITALHLTSKEMEPQQDAPFRGLSQVLANLPQINRLDIVTNDPADTILTEAHRHDLVVIGVSAHSPQKQTGLGGVAQKLLNECPAGLIAVKSKRPIPAEFPNEMVGQTAISVLVERWFAENTFFGDEFRDLERLYELKCQQNLKVSLALPSLNEEKTIGTVLEVIKSSLMDEISLLDEMVVIDSNSTDRTRQIAQDMGIPVYIHQQILPQYGFRVGKGEALWKSLYVTRGDIILWVDTDIENIHPRFVYSLLGALLIDPHTHFVKGFYRRPIRVNGKIQAGGGGRVTELTARPLLNMFYPELSGIVQPLSGEYGGRRSALEQLPFFSGYGVEIGLLIEIFEHFGLDAIAQVDLLKRIHHNQPLEALSKMSFSIIQAVFQKLEKKFERNILEEVNKTMKLIRYQPGHFFLDVEEIVERERPPIITIPEYREQQAL